MPDMAESPMLPTLSTQQAAGLVLGALGSRIAAASLGVKNAKRVRAWSEGESVKSLQVQARLLALAAVVQILRGRDLPDDLIRSWILSPNPLLGESSALETLASGDTVSTVRAARTFAAQ